MNRRGSDDSNLTTPPAPLGDSLGKFSQGPGSDQVIGNQLHLLLIVRK